MSEGGTQSAERGSLERIDLQLDPDTPLAVLARMAGEIGAEEIGRDARLLAERIAEGRFYTACIGQFKRGKSTLLNALVGEAVLPAGVVPVTAVVTVLRHGAHRAARVRFVSGRAQDVDVARVAEFVSEDLNPGNEKGVLAVEVFLNSPLLASGMCLVDTPGIGSVFMGNTETTRAFVPHVDAALVVVGADPPISGDELGLVEEASRHVRDIILVLNKADRLSEAERSDATAFAQRMLARSLGRPVGPALQVSASERLAGTGPPRDWELLTEALRALAQKSGSTLVRAAGRRGQRLIAERLLHELEEQMGALMRPLSESEARILALHRCAEDAERSLNDLSYLFTAEQERLSRRNAERRESFLSRCVPEALAEFREAVRSVPAATGPALRREATRLAREISTRWLDRWLAEQQPATEAMYREASERFVKLANEFLERLASSGEPALSDLPRSVSPDLGFRTPSRLYYTELFPMVARSPLGLLVDLAFPRVVRREAAAYLERLLAVNAMRIEGDIDERVLESRRRLELEIRGHLKSVYESAERALEKARRRLAAGSDAVQAGLRRLEELRARTETLRAGATAG